MIAQATPEVESPTDPRIESLDTLKILLWQHRQPDGIYHLGETALKQVHDYLWNKAQYQVMIERLAAVRRGE
jgi:hypothetical protein